MPSLSVTGLKGSPEAINKVWDDAVVQTLWSSVSQHVSLRITEVLASDRQGHPAGLPRPDRGGQGPLRRIRRQM